MYKSASRSQHFMRRAGSYATHGSRRGIVGVVPSELVMDLYPEQFDHYRKRAQEVIGIYAAHDEFFRPGSDVLAAIAACHHKDNDRALDAMTIVLERMRIG